MCFLDPPKEYGTGSNSAKSMAGVAKSRIRPPGGKKWTPNHYKNPKMTIQGGPWTPSEPHPLKVSGNAAITMRIRRESVILGVPRGRVGSTSGLYVA